MKTYDYYYSAKHEAHMKKMQAQFGGIYDTCSIYGMKYTEMITSGKTPVSNHWDDLDLVISNIAI